MAILVLIVLGLCFGSFVNALIWRLHEQRKTTSLAKRKELSIVHGRSMCPNCKHTLAVKDLMPLLSWIELRGKCRYCHKKFDDTPVAELLVAALFVLSYMFWPFTWSALSTSLFVVWLMMVVAFTALLLYDIRWQLLPNRIVYPLQALALPAALISWQLAPQSYGLLQVAGSLAVSAGLFWALYTVSKGRWIGYGDVRLAVAIGLVLGRIDLALLMLFTSSALGTAVAVPLLLTGKATRKSQLPFGPFLIGATVLVYLFGTNVIDWYMSQVLFL